MNEDEITEFYEEVGRRVRAARGDADLTQAQLAEQVGLQRSSIANLERGRQRVLLHFIAALANALHVEVADLLPPSEMTSDELNLVRLDDAVSEQPAADRDFVVDLIRTLAEMPRVIPKDSEDGTTRR